MSDEIHRQGKTRLVPLRGWPSLLIRLTVLLLVVAVLWRLPVPLFVVTPGVAVPAREMVTVSAPALAPDSRQRGHFLVTTLAAGEATVGSALLATFSPGSGIIARDDLLAPGQTLEDYLAESQQLMRQSQMQAIAAALQYLDYPVQVQGAGVEVGRVLDDLSPAGALAAGDLIVGVEGKPVAVMEDLQRALEALPAGARVNLDVVRQGRRLTVAVHLPEAEGTMHLNGLPVHAWTKDLRLNLPPEVDVTINAGDIGGPSAGLIFALEIVNRFTEGDLTAGQVVAGTGTINMDGQVGYVGGIPFKLRAAAKAGANLFLQPQPVPGEALPSHPRLDVAAAPDLATAVQLLTEAARID